jgi:uncharacterized RDD family membrane protein YckC
VSAPTDYSPELLAGNTQTFSATIAAPVVYAGFWRRFAAAIIDGIIVFVVLLVGNILLGQIVASTSAAFAALSFAYFIGLGVAYYVGLESGRRQATFGKRALGIVVTDLHGNRVSGMRALVRYLSKILSSMTMLIGYLMAGFTERKQALHDMIAGTLVVEKPTS